jgi:Domain of unknown function (DUF4145)
MSSFVARRTEVLLPIKDNRCGHCGNDTTWEMHEPYTLAEEYPHGAEEVSEHKVYSTLFCSTCLQPTLRQTVGQYREIDADWLNISTTVLYPTASTQLSDLPAAIERKYKSAPNTLAEMAQQLKELRNLGAHDAEDEVTNEDVPTIISFLEAILEYLCLKHTLITSTVLRYTSNIPLLKHTLIRTYQRA